MTIQQQPTHAITPGLPDQGTKGIRTQTATIFATMKVTINSFRAVATWKWDLPEESDDTCGICRVNFEGTCSKCKFPGDDCPIIVGECRHCFHMVGNMHEQPRSKNAS